MGLISNLRNRAAKALASPEANGQRANPTGSSMERGNVTSGILGTSEWTPLAYASYYAQSVLLYSAIKIRQDAIARVPLRVYAQDKDGNLEKVAPDHPVQEGLNRVNPWWTRGDLWRATETYLGLWGTAYWITVKDARGRTEIWPARPDMMRPIPDPNDYIAGFRYFNPSTGRPAQIYLPEEVTWMRYFNPMNELEGLAPLAPLRMSLDTAFDAMRANRFSLSNDASPGLIMVAEGNPGEDNLKLFYETWDERFKGPNKKGRPAVVAGMKPERMGLSPKEMEHVVTLRWDLEDVARAYNVPKPLLHDLERATYANILTARKSFWEDCIIPQLAFYEEELTEMYQPIAETEGQLVARFDLSKVEALQEDETAKATRRVQYVQTKIMTINEVRGEMGLEDVPWGDKPPAAPPAFGAPPRDDEEDDDDDEEDSERGRGSARRAFKRRLGTVDPARAEEVFLRSLATQERSMSQVMADLFDRQLDSILAALQAAAVGRTINGSVYFRDEAPHNRLGERVLAELLRPSQDIALLRSLDSRADPEPANTGGLRLFRPEEWTEEFAEEGGPVYRRALTDAANTQSKLYGLGVAFDVSRDIPQRWIADRTKFWARRVNQTTADMIMQSLTAANAAGDSIPMIADRLRAEVGIVNRAARATMIARTEMVSASNEGHIEAYEQSEVVEGKQWLAASDERTRDAHVTANGQVRKVRELFDVGGEKLEAPGASGGSPENIINCRCTVLPVLT